MIQFIRLMNDIIIRIINFFKIIKFIKKKNDIVFYVENSYQWFVFEQMINEILKKNKFKILYICGEKNDKSYQLVNLNFQRFYLGKRNILTWVFNNISAKILITSTPDLNIFHLKKTKFINHYIYVQHSLISMHMGYNLEAFNYFDSIFCSTEYQKNEIRKMEIANNLPKKYILEHGYPILERLIKEKNKIYQKKDSKMVLVAPTWSNQVKNLLFNFEIIKNLLNKNHKVIFRPHPITLLKEKKRIKIFNKKFSKNKNYSFDQEADSCNSILMADYLISDSSGIAIEYILLHKKKVIIIDINKKIKNKLYKKIKLIPIEEIIRNKYAILVKKNNFENISEYLVDKFINFQVNDLIYFDNKLNSARKAYNYITKLL